jgi:recombination protein RecT
MNNIVQQKQDGTSLQAQVEQKKKELTTVLQSTILEQYAYDLNSQSPESFKKKQEVAKFLSQLVATKDTSGRPAILSCTKESIMDCCVTFCNQELNFFRNQAYLYCFGKELKFMTSKDGYVSLAKQLNPDIEDFYYEVVYKKDEFEFSKVAGKTQITKHIQKLENITCNIADIVCAYATCVYKNGTHEADIMTIQEIMNALKTAHKGGFTDNHKLNPRIMLSKFPLRRLCKRKINQSANSELRNNIVFEDDYEESKAVAGMPSMEITLDEGQDYSEPSETEVLYADDQPILESEPNDDFYADLGDDEEPSDDELQMAMEEDSRNEPQTVSYSKWLNELKGNGWEQVPKTYDSVNKTVQVRKC